MDMKTKYATNQGDLRKILRRIRDEGMPSKVDKIFLKKIDITNDHSMGRIRAVIRTMGLIDDQLAPTEVWEKARKNFKETMLESLKKLYPDASNFLTYKDDDREKLKKHFRSETGLGSVAIEMATSTFLTIQAAANGNLDEQKEAKPARKLARQSKLPKRVTVSTSSKQAERKVEGNSPQPQVAINIQLTVPQDSTGEVYDKFFAAMKRHLFTNNE